MYIHRLSLTHSLPPSFSSLFFSPVLPCSSSSLFFRFPLLLSSLLHFPLLFPLLTRLIFPTSPFSSPSYPPSLFPSSPSHLSTKTRATQSEWSVFKDVDRRRQSARQFRQVFPQRQVHLGRDFGQHSQAVGLLQRQMPQDLSRPQE